MADISNLSDEQVVKLVREKDKEVYIEIIKRYQNKLMRYAFYLTQDDNKAADAVQEAFIKTYVNLNGFDIKKKFSSWIYRIVHNEAMNVLNKHGKHLQLNEDFDFDSGINVEDDFVKKELQAHTNSCLRQMSVMYREPLTLYFLEEKSYEEISDILRIPVGTVGTRINRAKVLMRKICQKTKK
ncbi:sigma-70 family RNA polymerase sigma factor [Candidatus Microgenomates bacterium]|jgi:RNA polymerase sigma-70 factor (ECF subfamily)|nr:MAG: sigma-70 family RNA polymerase sigma factor [Candidatus Microgenomates bacterium]